MDNRNFVFGLVEEQSAFETRNREFLMENEALWPLVQRIFNRPLPRESYAHVVVYILGRIAVQSFGAIHLLAANSYGTEAYKLLRAMYEETVTMAYLAANPSEAERFVEYAKFERGKFAKAAAQAELLFKNGANEELWEEIIQGYKEVEDRFVGGKCPTCGQRSMPSWTKLNMESMTQRAGNNLIKLYFPCYIGATKRTHVTPMSVAAHIEQDAGNNISFKMPPVRDYADLSLMYAHWLLITTLQIQDEFFSLGLNETLSKHDERMGAIWNKVMPDSSKPQ